MNSTSPLPAYSSLRKQPRIALAEQAPLQAPFTINLEPTNICNFRCKYCPVSFPDYEKISGGLFQMKMDDFVKISNQIIELSPRGIKTLNFYMMGEPFVN
jgi:MoaA/NifB/PqqE/SkfB family radical SAM enzyme